ncbi:MAG: helix-turn-helix domain-containing protein [bacterium]
MAELKYLNLKQSAQILSVSTRTLAGLATSGQITAYRLPSAANAKPRYRFKLSDIEAFMDGNRLLAINVHARKVFVENKKRIDVEAVKNYINSNSGR